MISDEALRQIWAHARAEAPREAVGVVLRGPGGLVVRRLQNVSPDPRHAFEVPPREWMALEDELAGAGGWVAVALYHSHPTGPAMLSTADRRWATPGGAPWAPGWALLVVGAAEGGAPTARIYSWNGHDWSAVPLICAERKHDLPGKPRLD